MMDQDSHNNNISGQKYLDGGWDLLVQYRAGHRGNYTIAYRHALIKASSIDNETNIRGYRKDGYTYWEVWERK